MKVVTSVTIFDDSVGTRISFTYSSVNDTTGEIVADNQRVSRVLADNTAKNYASALKAYAQTIADEL